MIFYKNSQSRVVNIILVHSFLNATLCNVSLDVCMRGIQLSDGWGTTPASTGIPPLYPSPFSLVLFGPSQPVANCPSRKGQSGWTVVRERVPTEKLTVCLCQGLVGPPQHQLRGPGAARGPEERLR